MAAATPNSTETSNTGAVKDAWLNHVNVRRRAFMCGRCKKTFPTSNALGGHQNAHRRERYEERRVDMEERVLRAIEDNPILYPNDHGSNQVQKQNQIIDYLAKPDEFGSGEAGPLTWFGFGDEFIEDEIVSLWENEIFYQKYLAELNDEGEVDVKEKKFEEGEVWMKEDVVLPELKLLSDEKVEGSSISSSTSMGAINGGGHGHGRYEDEDLDLTLKL